MARTGNPSICDDWNAKLPRILCDVVDSRGLCAAARADLLRGADGANAHADADSIYASIDEVLRLQSCDDVSPNDLHRRTFFFDELDH
eukprot:CAMPEP_0172696232 /NCGR_PEP_ID=MMETSP1074-20121228/27913_1 /TAXON_ID=2916 /ORGANISM="Ceratium fusus, Strain PA161109" /LENGTH=87 /DNA_ID=CAMNT_0013516951 /DNA_START=189 /DNA_END=449 /DNA_ORIENTATION=+